MKRVGGIGGAEIADIFKSWNSTEELCSYLVEISEVCMRTKDPEDGQTIVEIIMDKAGQKGTGLWTVINALELGVPVPTIYASLNARVMSSLKSQRLAAEKILNVPLITSSDLSHSSYDVNSIQDAVVLSTIASYAQGMELMRVASIDYKYELNMPSIARIWKGGCIIRSRLLERIQDAFTSNPNLENLMIDPWFADQINKRLPGLSNVVSLSAISGIPVPCFSSTLDYINSYRTGRLPQNLVQAMRDCFGSHTYERIDKEGSFHTEWLN